MGITLFERWSPEYALNNTIEDIKASGLDGLKKHPPPQGRHRAPPLGYKGIN